MNDLSKENVLMFTRTMGLGGTENVVLQLCKILKPYVHKIVVCSCGGINVDKLSEMGIVHYQIPDITNKDLQSFRTIYKKVSKIIDDENITIVHTHHRMAAFYIELLKKKKNIKFCSTAHNTFNDKKLLTMFAYHNSKVIACGKMVKDNLVNFYGLPSNQVTVIHNAIGPFKGEIVTDPVLDKLRKQNYTLVGNVGRLSEQKGMEYFIRSLPNVLIKCPNVRYVIVGDGEEKNKLYELAKQLNLEDKIIFLGYRDDIRNVISQLDFIVLSSLWEGLPLTPIEAFSVKKTVIGSAVDGTIEIIKDNENGFLIEPRNTKMIAEKVIELCKNPELLKYFEKNAYMTYRNNFCIDIFENKILNFYYSITK